jgi:predicted MFS family arabinose efflux permease
MVSGSLTVFTAAYVALGVLGGFAHSPSQSFSPGSRQSPGPFLMGVPPQQAQLIGAVPDESAVALSFNISALQAGIAIGSALGGVILSEKHADALLYKGTIFTLVVLLAAIAVERRARRRQTLKPAGISVVAGEAG